ncbi:MAG: Na(+)/H(+) antiporter subunit B [Eubacteriales bacterium]
MLEKILLVLMVVLAIISISTVKLRRSIIYLGLFSLVSSFVYLLYSAPDVAIAEAIIGSTIATVLYLVAIKKYKVFTIYFINRDDHAFNNQNIYEGRPQILIDIEKFLIKRELEPQIIYTQENYRNILDERNYDLLVHLEKEMTYLYGCSEDYQLDAIEEFLEKNKYSYLNLSIIRCK